MLGVFSAEGLLMSCHHHPQLLVSAVLALGMESPFRDPRKLCHRLPQFKSQEAMLAACSVEELLTSCPHHHRLLGSAALAAAAEHHFRDPVRRLFRQLQASKAHEDTAQAVQAQWPFPLYRLHRPPVHWAVPAVIAAGMLSAAWIHELRVQQWLLRAALAGLDPLRWPAIGLAVCYRESSWRRRRRLWQRLNK